MARRSSTQGVKRKGARWPEAPRETELALDSVEKPTAVNRNSRSRERTRKKLIEAAYHVMSRVGVEAATINEITEEADVGFGSFYNYFNSKDDIVRATFLKEAYQLSAYFDSVNIGIDDPSVRLIRNIRRILLRAGSDRVWGCFIVHTEFALHDFQTAFWKGHMRNLKEGLQKGIYNFRAAPETVGNVLFGAGVSVIRAILDGRAGPSVETEFAELVMTMLGIPRERSTLLAQESLPEIIGNADAVDRRPTIPTNPANTTMNRAKTPKE